MRMMRMGGPAALGGVALVAALGLTPRSAVACGCFVAPDPVSPVVQAGERILFAQQDGMVTAHIQIQYQGAASEFGWLVPLPSVPKVKLGSEELFTALEEATAPSFQINNTGSCGGGGGFGCGADAAFAQDFGVGQPPDPVLVELSSAGPYDYAVVKADSKAPMLEWLNNNRFFVPTATEQVLEPYIHPGAYFLAIKLRSGESSGDLQPIVLEYASDFPMVPIILTSVAATPDMGILVWVLAKTRAVPRNYQHVVINEDRIDWLNGVNNYAEVVKRAIDEADDHHAFITEYSGPTTPLLGRLDAPGRYGSRADLEETETFRRYAEHLDARPGLDWQRLEPLIRRYFGDPPQLQDSYADRQAYFLKLAEFASSPEALSGFEAVSLTAEIWERIVTPNLEAGELFRLHRRLTRLYTVLSPEEMTADPVFAFNANLPDVPRSHFADLQNNCGGDPPFLLTLEDGREYPLQSSTDNVSQAAPNAAFAARVEVLREEGQAEVIRTGATTESTGEGCSSKRSKGGGAADLVLLLSVVLGQRGWARRATRARSRDLPA